jgi:hypothetical protein
MRCRISQSAASSDQARNHGSNGRPARQTSGHDTRQAVQTREAISWDNVSSDWIRSSWSVVRQLPRQRLAQSEDQSREQPRTLVFLFRLLGSGVSLLSIKTCARKKRHLYWILPRTAGPCQCSHSIGKRMKGLLPRCCQVPNADFSASGGSVCCSRSR